jgi:pimeloyl-ACP methyl ester carboxylesterase
MAYGLRKGQKRKSKRLLRLLDNTTALKDFRELNGLTMESIHQVTCPTLAIYGELSPFLPVCQHLKENMSCCKSVIVPTGHFHPGLEPKLFVKHVKDFLRDPKRSVAKQQEAYQQETIPPKGSVLHNIEPH